MRAIGRACMTERKRGTPARERGTDADGNAVPPGRRLGPEARERQSVEKAI
ncbi:hypothetical protein BSIN_4948 [Burkholderia singularis]|uniref:Uncharacterized protein n=1 Tax=Burkholderia singularis TaxID=1503053 RepID=A0A238H9M7_9BURK|nr:hypothetical protein BSIN_4948 [Burkholderia singularis]